MNSKILMGATLLSTLPTLAIGAKNNKPNLIIVMTDEHNFRTLSCYRNLLPEAQQKMWGSEAAKIKTPNIDRLAKGGLLMQNFNAVQPVSSPSRGAFFTGLYSQTNGVTKNDLVLNDVRTIGDELRDAGYETGYCGKLHLNGTAKPGWHPERDFGFTDNRYMFNRGHWKVLKVGAKQEGVVLDMEPGAMKDMNDDTFTTDFLTNRTLEFIDKNYDKPFCYVLNIPDPHDPNVVREPYASMYNDIKFEMPATSKAANGNYSWQRKSPNLAFFRPNHYFAKYFGMVSCIDDNIGRLLDKLEERKILENTIVVFTSDHGDMMGEHNRDNKDVPYMASAKVPMLVYYKGKIKAGTVNENMMGSVDFVPTMLSVMGVDAKQESHGRDLSSVILKNKFDGKSRDMVISKIPGSWIAVFTPNLKMIFTKGTGVADPVLFDLERDPDELKNFYGESGYSSQLKEMAQYLLDYIKEYKEPMGSDGSLIKSIHDVIKNN